MKKITKVITTLMLITASVLTCSANAKTEDDKITIYFARHGKTILNTFDKVQGWSDSPLTEQGIEVAQYLGEGLKGIPFDRYYSSDAGRQRETMKVILNQQRIYDYKLIELPGLREVFLGGFEGGPNSVMFEASMKLVGGYSSLADYMKDYKAGKITPILLVDKISQADPMQLAENAQKVKARTQDALRTIVQNAQQNGDKTVLAISSGTSIQIMISDLTDNPAKNNPLSNATIVKIIYQGGKYSVDEIGSMEYVNKGKKLLNK